jgi:hypothetical protein
MGKSYNSKVESFSKRSNQNDKKQEQQKKIQEKRNLKNKMFYQ